VPISYISHLTANQKPPDKLSIQQVQPYALTPPCKEHVAYGKERDKLTGLIEICTGAAHGQEFAINIHNIHELIRIQKDHLVAQLQDIEYYLSKTILHDSCATVPRMSLRYQETLEEWTA